MSRPHHYRRSRSGTYCHVRLLMTVSFTIVCAFIIGGAAASTSSTTSSPSQTASNGTASRPADSTSASNSSNNAYMEDLINTYFDPNTRNLSSAGLNELMEAIGVREPECGGHGKEVYGLCECDEGYELTVKGEGIVCVSSQTAVPPEDPHNHTHEEGEPSTANRRDVSVESNARTKRQSSSYSLECFKDADAMYQAFGIDLIQGANEQDFKDMIAPTLLSMVQSRECIPPSLIVTSPMVDPEPASAVSDPHAGHDHTHGHDVDPADYQSKGSAYLGAFIAVAVVSITSVVGVLFLPVLLRFKSISQYVLMAMVALAIGVLLGDSIMHLLPAAFGAHSHGVDEEVTLWMLFGRTMCVIAGIYFLYFVETLLEMIGLGHAHSHEIVPITGVGIRKASRMADDFVSYQSTTLTYNNDDGIAMESCFSVTPAPEKSRREEEGPPVQGVEDVDDTETRSNGSDSRSFPKFEGWKNVDNVVWLITIGDGLHNMVDGISIGASFLVSKQLGIATAVAVFLHELPQELGDFGILISAGTGVKRAVLLNFLSAVTAFLGVIIGIEAGTSGNNWILAFSAGMFIYIALGTMLPQLRDETLFDKNHPRRTHLVQHLFFIVGWMCMMAISLDEIFAEENHHH